LNPLPSSLLRPHAGSFAALHRFADCALVALSLFLCCRLYGVEADGKYWFAALLAIVVFAFAAEFTHLYSSWRLHSFRDEALELLLVVLMVSAAVVGAAFLSKTSASFSRVVIVTWCGAAFSVLMLERVMIRLALRAVRRRGRNTRTLAIAGAGLTAINVVKQVRSAEWSGLEVTAFYDASATIGSRPIAEVPIEVKGDLRDLVNLARNAEIDYVYIALPTREEDQVMWLVDELADTTASVYVVPDLFIFQLKQARWTNVGGLPIVSIYESPFDGMNGWLKRVEDLLLGTAILVVAAIPMLAIAIAIKCTSKGSILFKQRRYGLNGKVVEVWKFRTMTCSDDGDVVRQATKCDARITRLGGFLRRSSLDELPQFFNVLAGDLSVVGPRPHAVAHNEQYRSLIPGYMLRHKVKPGITGWAQINGWRGETDTLEKMQKRVECDLEYVQHWSLWLDLKIVALTIIKGPYSKNAY
jgi:putative colanic acid biosynthesis UDP-glucose lipid carrier transferase